MTASERCAARLLVRLTTMATGVIIVAMVAMCSLGIPNSMSFSAATESAAAKPTFQLQ